MSIKQPFGKLAALDCGPILPLEILESAAGFYIGTCTTEGPYTRESVEYWKTDDEARSALKEHTWTQRSQV